MIFSVLNAPYVHFSHTKSTTKHTFALIPDKLTHWRYAVFTQMKQYIMYCSSALSYACLD